MKAFNVVLRLRRDNDYNYEKIRDSFIPANGEICLVDTLSDGLRAVCGDGTTTFGNLEYIDGALIKGYYISSDFYVDAARTATLPKHTLKAYVDIPSGKIYHYDGTKYTEISPQTCATAEVAGVMKLYDTTGDNTDGTMTQKVITEKINEKMEARVDEENEELLIFS